MSMEGISLSLSLPVVLCLVLLHSIVSLFLFICGSFICFSLSITLYLSWPPLLLACLLSLSSLIVFLFYLCQYSFFFFCLPFHPHPCQSMLNLLFSYFNDSFQIPCLIIPFCEQVTVGSKGNSLNFLKLQVTVPKAKEFCLASLFKKVAIRGSRKRDADGKFWEFVEKGIF